MIFVVLLSTLLNNESWTNPNDVISSDVKGYYGYLPAVFIHNDLEFNNLEVYNIEGDFKLWYYYTEDSVKYIKFPPGMAIMYSPFFGAAHASTSFNDAPPNGYSYPYQIALLIGSLFYTVLGIFFLCKLLLLHFSDRATASTILVLFLATNLYYYTTYDFALTHGYSFALLSAFLYGTIRWLRTFQWRYVFLLGFSGGLLVAVRNIDILFLSFVFLYDIRSVKDLKERGQLLFQKRAQVLIGIACLFLMLLPQLLYNLYISGSVFLYAYTDERFFFFAPHLFDSLLSYRNGWLVYTPVMVLSILGLFYLKKRVPSMFVFVFLNVPLYYYVLASWWCWWFVGIGNRAYINLYPILAFALAALFTYLYESKRWKLYLTSLFILGTIVLNWIQSEQFKLGLIHWDGMNKELYWHVFGKEACTQSQSLLVQTPDTQDAKRGLNTVWVSKIDTLSRQHFSFEHLTPSDSAFYKFRTQSDAHHGKTALFVPVNQEWPGTQEFRIPEGTTHISFKAWIRGEGESFLVVQTDLPRPFHYFSDEVIATDGAWRQVEMLATPFQDVVYPSMLFYLWNRGLKPAYIDDVSIICMHIEPVKKTL